MIRVLVYVALLFVLAVGFAWLAERPGGVAITWQGYEIKTTLMAAAMVVAALFVAIALAWAFVRGVVRTPRTVGQMIGARRRDRGYRALSRGMIAVGAGDERAARRAAHESQSLLGKEPLVLLLSAQAAQLAGDDQGARSAFETLVERPDTRVLGLHGLFVEARRQGEHAAARHFAEEATLIAPRTGWAGAALFEYQSQGADWQGALATLAVNAEAGIVDKDRGKRLRAVLLTAHAMELEAGRPDEARAKAIEAHRLAADLAPAAVTAARLLTRNGEIRRATRLLETAWKASPHPEIAEAYAAVRPGDSVRDRLKRVRRLAGLRPNHPEGVLAVARAAIDARDWQAARTALGGLTRAEPTERVCLMMADIEEGEHGDEGRVRTWLTRARWARGDPVWTADGHVFDAWAPVSPISGRVDAFEWRVVAEQLAPRRGDGAEPDEGPAAIEAMPATESAAAAGVPSAPPEPPAPAQGAGKPMRVDEKGPATERGGQRPEVEAASNATKVEVVQPSPDDPGPEAGMEDEESRRLSGLVS